MSGVWKTTGFSVIGCGLVGLAFIARCGSGFNDGAAGGVRAVSNSQEISTAVGNDEAKGDRPRHRPSPMSDDEVKAFLRDTIIRRLDLEHVSLQGALRTISDILHQQNPDGRLPVIKMDPNWPTAQSETLRVNDLRVHDIPVGIALKYVCEQTACVYSIHNGTVLVDRWRPMEVETYERFLSEPKIAEFEIQDASLMDAVATLQAAAMKADFEPEKPPICISAANEKLQAALLRGEAGKRVRGVSMRNATIKEALDEICKQTGARYNFFEGQIDIEVNE